MVIHKYYVYKYYINKFCSLFFYIVLHKIKKCTLQIQSSLIIINCPAQKMKHQVSSSKEESDSADIVYNSTESRRMTTMIDERKTCEFISLF